MTTRKHDRLRVLSSEPAEPEFSPGVDEPPSELDRREMMKLLAAGAGLAGVGSLAGCMEEPRERIMPRVTNPPELTPGVPLSYATSMVIDGFATGLLVQTYEARPTKVEGNPDHPASLGHTMTYHQASVLDLYDPHRARGPLEAGTPTMLDRLLRNIARREPMTGLWFLMHPQSSPLLADLIAAVRQRHPGTRFAFHSPLDRRQVYEGARLAFGRPLEAQYRFTQADVVVSLDADFMGAMPNSVRWAYDFAQRRRLHGPGGQMSRLYLAEPRPSPTGSLADHRLPARPSEIALLAQALLSAVQGATAPSGNLTPRQQRWVQAAASDLGSRRGRSLVIAGDRQPAAVHAAVHAINQAIGAIGSTVAFTEPAILEPLGDGLPELASAMQSGQVQTLVIVETNPVYTAPPELDFPALLAKVPETLYAGDMLDETARQCQWFVPLSHYMESWGDARAYDGSISLIQPLIRRMYDSVSVWELVAAFAGDEQPDGHRLVRQRYADEAADAGLLTWQKHLQLGVIPNTALPPQQVSAGAGAAPPQLSGAGSSFEVSFEESPSVYDGRFAANSWLQELPKPHTKITWGNAAVVSPATARELGVGNEDVVRLVRGAFHVDLPVYVLPGHADRCVTVELGYGRSAGGPVAEGVGVNVYRIRPPSPASHASPVQVIATGGTQRLAYTQKVFDQHGRDIARYAEAAFYQAQPQFTEAQRGPLPSWLPEFFENNYQWGMTIDTMICTGCSSCVVACQAENNIPVVGKKGVIDDREMHWLRIDTYREISGDDVEFIHQPMLCQHCEKAPCEYVCPVYATQHSPDGLNEMVYNRCIGTRFCSNNCPYKVRRFNWFDYTEDTPKTKQLQFNPNVTVRARGVMEKCTFCVQRIRAAEIVARRERREIQPGEVATACQQACPTGAIQFGLLHHNGTNVVEWRKEPRAYAVLHDLGTRPRVMYLAKITNPNPELDD